MLKIIARFYLCFIIYLLWVEVCVIAGVSVTYHNQYYHFILEIEKSVTAEVSHPDIEPRVRK